MFIFLTTCPFSLLPPRGKTQCAIPLLVCSLLGQVIADYITVGLQYSAVETRIPVARRLKYLEAWKTKVRLKKSTNTNLFMTKATLSTATKITSVKHGLILLRN